MHVLHMHQFALGKFYTHGDSATGDYTLVPWNGLWILHGALFAGEVLSAMQLLTITKIRKTPYFISMVKSKSVEKATTHILHMEQHNS